nr:MAG TPA_asm: Single strand binding protein [Caudoviricetes sp.]
MNKCIFVGRTTRDVELRYTQSANPLAVGRTSIAVESGYGDKKKTSFFNISAFGKTAETMDKFVKKGTKIILECEAVQNEYTDREGKKQNRVSFIVKSFEFAESKVASSSAGQTSDAPKSQSNADGFYPIDNTIEDDDLPF